VLSFQKRFDCENAFGKQHELEKKVKGIIDLCLYKLWSAGGLMFTLGDPFLIGIIDFIAPNSNYQRHWPCKGGKFQCLFLSNFGFSNHLSLAVFTGFDDIFGI